MAFIANTNVNALTSLTNTKYTQTQLSNSLEKLSSGLRINKAADDASGLTIADSLRAQAKGLGQASKNANDSIGVIRIADKSISEQERALETIKAKAIQAAQDTQNRASRRAIQADISRLIEHVDNIANQTSYNGIKLLSGSFINKQFQVGAYSHETINASIGSTNSNKIGSIRKETTAEVTTGGEVTLSFRNPKGGKQVTLESVKIDTKSGSGLGALVEVINKNSDMIGVRAKATVRMTGSKAISAGDLKGLTINGVSIGDVQNVQANDKTGTLTNAINKYTAETGVHATVDQQGRLQLSANDGRGINVTSRKPVVPAPTDGSPTTEGGGAAAIMNIAGVDNPQGKTTYGRLTLTQMGANDIEVTAVQKDAGGNDVEDFNDALKNSTTANFNLRDVLSAFTGKQMDAAGAFANGVELDGAGASATAAGISGGYISSGVNSKTGANVVIDIADSGIEHLDQIRADLGSVQNQLEATISNLNVTQVNVKAAESTIRDVNFASETANFSKNNILSQSGSYALSQSNQLQQQIMRLLQ